jgi:hypothetical protein
MNEQLENFRKRLRENKKLGFSSVFKERFGLVTSVTAFILSIISSYFSLVRDVDDLRVVVSGETELMLSKEKAEGEILNVRSNHRLTFINAGNRSVSISHIELFLTKGNKTGEKPSCELPIYGYLFYPDFSPFVVKPSEIFVTPEMKPSPRKEVPERNGWLTSKPILPEGEDSHYFVVCMNITAITPSRTLRDIQVPISQEQVSRSSYGRTVFCVNCPNVDQKGEPFVILNNRWPL